MLYLGIDQHARQITISLRDDSGDVLQARQVSTEPKKISAFFQQLTGERLRNGESFVAVLEVCGFRRCGPVHRVTMLPARGPWSWRAG
jgi:transposase